MVGVDGATPRKTYQKHANTIMMRFHEAKQRGETTVTVWGSGTPRREFMYSKDCAEMIVILAEKKSTHEIFEKKLQGKQSHINIGTGEDISIRELSEKIAQLTEFQGLINFDNSRPDGTPRKLQDISIIRLTISFKPTELDIGLQKTYE